MKNYTTDQIKNLALVGNAGSGKTTLAESMLFEGGVIERRGHVSNKNTVSDHTELEHENDSSVYSSIMYTEYNNSKINLLDAPGADDFVGGAVSSIYIADAAIMLINAQNGVEVGTDNHNRWLDSFNKPSVFFVNHCDHEKTNFDKTFESLKESFGGAVVLAQFPGNAGPGFNTVIDIIQLKQYVYSTEGEKPEVKDIDSEYADRAEELRNELIEKAAENDEKLMELFFENDGLTEEEMRSGITAGLISRGMMPVFCGSAEKNIGVGRLLEFISNAVPSANQFDGMKTNEGNDVAYDASTNASLFVFKTSVESHIGEVSILRWFPVRLTKVWTLRTNVPKTKSVSLKSFHPTEKTGLK